MSAAAKISILANTLDRSIKVSKLKSTAMQVIADEGGDTSGLKVFKHGDGAQFAYEMYKEYVSEGNFQYFPSFMQKLDQMVYEFRGNQPLELMEEDDDDEDEGGSNLSSKGRSKRKSKYKPVKKRPKSVSPIPSTDGSSNNDVEDDNSVVVSKVLERIKRNARR